MRPTCLRSSKCRMRSGWRRRTARRIWSSTTRRRRRGGGLRVIIAAAGGAAHLAGLCAAKTMLPILGVPMESKALHGLDSLLSTVQMPAGIPVATLAIGEPGAKNAALFAVAILALEDSALRQRLASYRQQQTQAVIDATL